MEFDLRTFPDERSGQIAALREFDELDRYTYLVAGCVGEFWTTHDLRAYARHAERAARDDGARGVRFGKALQMTNVLRDCGKDLRIGRCYLPQTMLDPYGLIAQDLLAPANSLRARPVDDRTRAQDAGLISARPWTTRWRFPRFRCACASPVCGRF